MSIEALELIVFDSLKNSFLVKTLHSSATLEKHFSIDNLIKW